MRTTSKQGIDLIEKYEGCKLKAYKPVRAERYYTIGYGHYGPDVKANMMITLAQAEAYLRSDLKKFEAYVNDGGYVSITESLNQNQFDALVSFTYNCGAGNLRRLCLGRSAKEISEKITVYNRGAHGKILTGLVRRRAEEKALFLKPVENMQVLLKDGYDWSLVFNPRYYANRYQDLAKAGITTDAELFNHFQSNGMNESRQGCEDFNVVVYRQKNPDLEVFGNNMPEYYRHYMRIGHMEARQHK